MTEDCDFVAAPFSFILGESPVGENARIGVAESAMREVSER